MFCQNLVDIQAPFLAANESTFAAWPSPVPTEVGPVRARCTSLTTSLRLLHCTSPLTGAPLVAVVSLPAAGPRPFAAVTLRRAAARLFAAVISSSR